MWGPSLIDLSAEELKQRASSSKQAGNTAYGKREYRKAIDFYTQVLAVGDHVHLLLAFSPPLAGARLCFLIPQMTLSEPIVLPRF